MYFLSSSLVLKEPPHQNCLVWLLASSTLHRAVSEGNDEEKAHIVCKASQVGKYSIEIHMNSTHVQWAHGLCVSQDSLFLFSPPSLHNSMLCSVGVRKARGLFPVVMWVPGAAVML